MENEGASSSCTTAEEAEEKQEASTSTSSTSFTSNPTDSAVTSSGCFATPSQGVGGGSRISVNPFAIRISAPTRSVADSTENKDAPKLVLRPSALSAQAEKIKFQTTQDTNSSTDGKENSPAEGNVAKIPRLSMHESNGKVPHGEHFTSSISTSADMLVAKTSPSKALFSPENNAFSLGAHKPDNQSSNGGGFVFGQNLHERALNYDATHESPSSPSASSTLTFEETALKEEELEKLEQQNREEKLTKSLSESAKEYESKQVKRKFDEVTVVTGEEEESNVLHINCKLFAFDNGTANWQERGRGMLRLNDKEHDGGLNSRLVMRTHGSLRVILNTKVWSGMTVENPSQKTVRLTAYDPEGIKVFLVMATTKDAEQLYQALRWRVKTLKSKQSKEAQADRKSSSEEPSSSSSVPNPPEGPLASPETSGADSSSETVPSVSFSAVGNSEGVADSTEVKS